MMIYIHEVPPPGISPDLKCMPAGWLLRRPVLLAPAPATAVPSKHTRGCLRARAALMLTASQSICSQVMACHTVGGAARRMDLWHCGVAILTTVRMATPHRASQRHWHGLSERRCVT